METVKVENKIHLTPTRPKRWSPSFDRDDGASFAEGVRVLGEGGSTGDLSHENSQVGPDSPTTAKRRRLELWNEATTSALSSCSGTPSRGTTPDTTLEDSILSSLSTPTDSPAGTLTRDFRKRYKKDELWPAIESNYQYLMDDEIIETCKSTESDLSWDEDDVTITTKVSFTEFMQQYKELTDWLNQIQVVTHGAGSSRSEKYLNQAYHEELLQSSPRRKLFNDYARQLLRRYPSLKEEITLRLQHLNSQWTALQEVVGPHNGSHDTRTMINDLGLDLSCIRGWVTGVEGRLLPLCVRPTWTADHIEAQLQDHQILQREIESQSKVISAVLKLSERLQNEEFGDVDDAARTERDLHQSTAVKLERRWHNVWLRSLEWQCRLEEALHQLKNSGGKPLHSSDPALWHDFDSSSFLDGFSSDEQVELSSETAANGGGRGESSDEPNLSDVIPFYADEYEKIVEVEETAEDREVSKLSREMRQRRQGTQLLLDSSLSKSSSNLNELKAEIMDTLDETAFSRGSFFGSKLKNGKSESRDIGYSSEGYSNDEQLDPADHRHNLMRAPSLNGLNFNDQQNRCRKTSGLSVSSDNGVVRRRPASLPLDGSLHYLNTNLTATNKDSPWRHSITSAYDTSSNCGSDPEAVIIEDGASIDPNAESLNYKAIINSPTKEFYKMITVDTDFSTDRNDTDEPLSSADPSASPGQDTRLEIPETAVTTSSLQCDRQLGSISETDLAEDVTDSKIHLEDVEQGVLEYCEETSQLNHQQPVCHFVKEDSSVCNDEEFSAQGISQWQSGSKKPSKPGGKRRLCLAEGVTGTDTSSPRSGTDSLVDSSCEASGEDTSDDESSDGEFSTASDNEECSARSAFSSFNTLVGSERNLRDRPDSNSANTYPGMSRSASSYSNSDRVKSKTKARRSQRDRPWSIVAVSDLKKELNAKEKSVFISESAIDTMYSSASIDNKNSVYTSTPISKLQEKSSPSLQITAYATFPRDKSKPSRPRHVRRTKSMEERDAKLAASNSSKRKLAYDNSAACTPDSGISNIYYPISIVVSSPDVETNRNQSCHTEDGLAPLSLIEGLEHIKVYSSSSGSDTDLGAYMTPKQSMSESGCESDEFGVSTGSFSETAWDNYQDPLYPTASEAPTEEPLQWEPQDEMEFEDEEFKLSGNGIKLSAEVIAEKADKHRAKDRKPAAYTRDDDSDSDLEDLHHMIQQSVEQLQVTDCSLKKRRRDPMGTGISLDPSKYAEHVLTCQTNVKCLLEVLDLPISGHEAHQIEVLMSKWNQLCAFAMERLNQSQQLCRMYGDLSKVKATVSEVMKDMVVGSFDDVSQMDAAVRTLQNKAADVCRDCEHLGTMKESVTEFSQSNASIPMEQFHAKAASSCSIMEKAAKRCQCRVKELESLLSKWREFEIKSGELSQILAREQQQLQLMDLSKRQDGQLQVNIQKLRDISSDLESHEVKLSQLAELKRQLKNVCSDTAMKNMSLQMAALKKDHVALTHTCDHGFSQLIEKEGEATVFKELAAAETHSPNEGRRSLPRAVSRLLKGAAPVVAMAALMYLTLPENWEDLGEFGIRISPELSYIRGPPPQ